MKEQIADTVEKVYMNRDSICSACGHTKQWHKDNRPRHMFRSVGQPGGLIEKPEQGGQQRTELPADPVLRLALIERGVLSPDDLRAAEEKLKAAGFAVATAEVQGEERT